MTPPERWKAGEAPVAGPEGGASLDGEGCERCIRHVVAAQFQLCNEVVQDAAVVLTWTHLDHPGPAQQRVRECHGLTDRCRPREDSRVVLQQLLGREGAARDSISGITLLRGERVGS